MLTRIFLMSLFVIIFFIFMYTFDFIYTLLLGQIMWTIVKLYVQELQFICCSGRNFIILFFVFIFLNSFLQFDFKLLCTIKIDVNKINLSASVKSERKV